VKIYFHRVLLGFFEKWDKSPQRKWDKGAAMSSVDSCKLVMVNFPITNSE
jgi:hypothetical protein